MSFEPSYFKADLFKVLSNPMRIQILDALRTGERSVNDIAEGLESEPSSISQQLAVLRSRNLVTSRKQGNFVFYSIRDPAIFKILDAALEVFNNHLVNVRDARKSWHETAYLAPFAQCHTLAQCELPALVAEQKIIEFK